jgi:hypothetical protein
MLNLLGGAAALEVTFKPDVGYLNLRANKQITNDSIFEFIDFYCENILNEKKYYLYTGDGQLGGFYDLANNHPCGPYFHDTLNPGSITITTFNKEKRYFISTFEMILINKNCGADSLMHITNGKFTYNY